MFNWIRKFFIKTPYRCCMELHNQLGCYLSLQIPSMGPIEGFRGFFHENSFMIGHRMFDIESDNDTQLKQIHDKILSVYDFDPKDKNISIIKGKQTVYIPSKKIFVSLPPDGVFVYKKDKVKVFI